MLQHSNYTLYLHSVNFKHRDFAFSRNCIKIVTYETFVYISMQSGAKNQAGYKIPRHCKKAVIFGTHKIINIVNVTQTLLKQNILNTHRWLVG